MWGTRLLSAVLDEVSGLEFGHGQPQLLLRVHDDWAVPGYWLFDRFAGDEEEADAFGACQDLDFVAPVKEDERVVVCVVYRLRIGVRA